MAAFVQSKAASFTDDEASLTFDTPVTPGNTVVVCIAKLNAILEYDNLNDNQTGVYSLVLHHADTGSRQVYQFAAPNAAGGTTTVTLNLSNIQSISWAILELNAGSAAGSVGAQSGSSTSHAAANLSNTQDDAVFVLASCANVGISLPESVTAGDGYTNRVQQSALYVQTKDVSAVETNDASFTTGNVRRFSHALAVYEGLPVAIMGSFVHGMHGTVNSTGTGLFNMDGTPRTINKPGGITIGGYLDITGDVTISGTLTGAGSGGGAYRPLTLGTEPMVFVSDGAGESIMVPFTP